MQELVERLQSFSKTFKEYQDDENALYTAVNDLPKDKIDELLDGYKNVLTSFAPVNLLRYVILNLLKAGDQITPDTVESIKTRIRDKDTDYFSKYGQALTDGLTQYPDRVKDVFTAWQNPFRIFYIFFYSGKQKESLEKDLEKLATHLIKELKLKGFKHHIVTYSGPQNFGYASPWLALFPKQKVSHKKAIQLFLRIHGEILEAGLISGWDVRDKKSNDVEECITLKEAIQKLQSKKAEAIDKNNALINFWKFAPGEAGKHWDEFYKQGIMAIGWDSIGDLRQYENTDALAKALGVKDGANSNTVWSIENFRDASIGDIIIANRGKSKSLGIGVITGEYRHEKSRKEYTHIRPVNWIVNDLVDYDKTIFRPDTFSPTLKWQTIKKKYLEQYPEHEKVLQDIDAGRSQNIQISTQPKEGKNYWWLNANPKIWSIDSYEVGDIQTYTSHNERKNKRRVYKYFQEVQPGDLIIGYESTPVKKVKAIFEVTEALHVDDNEGEIFSFEIIDKVHDPIEWSELRTNPELENCEVFNNNQGSLFKLTEDEYEIIRDLIDERNIVHEVEQEEIKVQTYTVKQALEEIFLEEQEFSNILSALRFRKNIILQGPPGVGKTYLAKKLAYSHMHSIDENRVRMVQFHQSYAYEDFIQGIRPNDHNGFQRKNGVFYQFCKKAELDPDHDYFFIIDEINRGNLSKIFGELLMLIEADKRGNNYRMPLTYATKDDELFSVPHNIFLIGTMNTADRSLALVDYALRRRFAFIDLTPKFNHKFKTFIGKTISPKILSRIVNHFLHLNELICKDKNLGPGFQVGHSYFCNLELQDGEDKWYESIIQHEIAPLLREYWFDDLDTAEQHISRLLAD